MNIEKQIIEYRAEQSEQKRCDMQKLNESILRLNRASKIWFLDGKDDNGKIVSNPNIGYGVQTIKYARGKTKEFYQKGLSANTTGISIYIVRIDDKKYLANTYGDIIGKAIITGYCIKFKSLTDINIDILIEAIKYSLIRNWK